eukprot:TRINITY_DN336_c0_g1_i2.p1 TRINITY_DN336_c0_g1~~TRINITY_DN336_c0_g1_i2.p1  ORF type:complete len:271 (+),score=55.18 TRINITY_DN336_c0_g1_i2:122-814(+)
MTKKVVQSQLSTENPTQSIFPPSKEIQKKSKPRSTKKSSVLKKKKFDYTIDYAEVNCREHPEMYTVGKGEQGVLMIQPYKAEILPHWRFKNPEIAKESSEKIYDMFLDYKKNGDFVGMDMARKFLMMGWTRSRRYANHKTGRKYSDKDLPVPKKKDINEHDILFNDEGNFRDMRNRHHHLKTLTKEVAPNDEDPVKAESAVIFRKLYLKAWEDEEYQQMLSDHVAKYNME